MGYCRKYVDADISYFLMSIKYIHRSICTHKGIYFIEYINIYTHACVKNLTG